MAVPQPEEQHYGEKHAKYLEEIAETCQGLAELTERALEEGFLPLVLGGDHSIAVGIVGRSCRAFFRQAGEEDRLHLARRARRHEHAGNIAFRQRARHAAGGDHRLRAAGTGGSCWAMHPKVEPRNVALVGMRDLDAKERRLIKESGVHAFTMRDIDERGMREVMSEALRFATDDTDGVAVSLDMDFVDPAMRPAWARRCAAASRIAKAHLAMEMIADSKAMVSFEMVEINPVIDLHNKTALLGVEMVLSAWARRFSSSRPLARKGPRHEPEKKAARGSDIRRAVGRARSLAGFGGVGDSRARSGKV